MITKISGNLLRLNDESAVFDVPPFEYEVFIPDFIRRQLQLDIGREIQLHTTHYLDGNVAQGGKLSPRLIGFLSEFEREFFELFCSVDGVGVKKALRAMVRPVQDIAIAIEQQDIKALSTLPGIGPATAERISAKLRRRMAKFLLLVPREEVALDGIERSLVDEVFQILLSLGHAEAEARQMLDQAVSTKKKHKDVESLLQSVYQTAHGE